MKIALLLTLLILAPGLMAQEVDPNNSTDHAAAVEPDPVPAADPAQAQADLLLAYKKEYAFLTSQVNNIKSRLAEYKQNAACLLYTSPSPRDRTRSRMPSSA